MPIDPGIDRRPDNRSRGAQIDPDLVKEVAEKVFQMLKRDLRIERERQSLRNNPFHRSGG